MIIFQRLSLENIQLLELKYTKKNKPQMLDQILYTNQHYENIQIMIHSIMLKGHTLCSLLRASVLYAEKLEFGKHRINEIK